MVAVRQLLVRLLLQVAVVLEDTERQRVLLELLIQEAEAAAAATKELAAQTHQTAAQAAPAS